MIKYFTSYQELDALGEALSKSYIEKAAVKDVMCFDIEGFITEGLGCRICYESFAEKESDKLGFLSDGIIPLRVWRKGKKTPVMFPKDTIVIERYLLRPTESGRRRFTLAHEAAHAVMQRHCPTQHAACFRSEYDGEANYKAEDLKRIMSIEETFANRLGAAILMPPFLVQKALDKHNNGQPVVCYGREVPAAEQKLLMQRMADDLGVSYTALFYRLKELKLFDVRPMDEYINEKIMTGGPQ